LYRAVIRAPIALRFDLTPTSFTFSQWLAPVTSLRNSEGDSFWFQEGKLRRSSPSWTLIGELITEPTDS